MRNRLSWMAVGLAVAGAWPAEGAAQATAEAPFAVTSRGRPLPRAERAVVVVRDSAPPRPAADTARATPRPGAPRTHVVAYGDTFYGIANQYGVTAAALRAANPGVDQEKLVSGATLRIPPATSRPAAVAAPARARSAPARRTHRVEPGESLWGIARRYEVSMDAIRRANDLESERVRIGQTLVIPEAD